MGEEHLEPAVVGAAIEKDAGARSVSHGENDGRTRTD